jgi:hypothetical protein
MQMKNSLFSLFFGLLFFTISGFADQKTACVKNDLVGGMNTCEGGQGSQFWTYLYNADPHAKFETCTRKREAKFCEMAPANFLWAKAKPTGEKVCIQRFDTQFGDFCKQDPQHYSYILIEGL